MPGETGEDVPFTLQGSLHCHTLNVLGVTGVEGGGRGGGHCPLPSFDKSKAQDDQGNKMTEMWDKGTRNHYSSKTILEKIFPRKAILTVKGILFVTSSPKIYNGVHYFSAEAVVNFKA